MLRRQFTLDEYFAWVLCAARVRDKVDRELGLLMLAAADDDSQWPAVHDRLNVIGDFKGADRLRRIIS
jgi:hypothetical protein